MNSFGKEITVSMTVVDSDSLEWSNEISDLFFCSDCMYKILDEFLQSGTEIALVLVNKNLLKTYSKFYRRRLISNPKYFVSSISMVEWARSVKCPVTIQSVAAGGSIEVLQWMKAKEPNTPLSGETIGAAAAGGHIHILQWIHSQEPLSSSNLRICTHNAAYKGHLNVLKYLVFEIHFNEFNEDTYIAAASGGHLHILQWLRNDLLSHMNISITSCPWNTTVCSSAAKNGHLHVIQWLRSQEPPCPWNETTCIEAASSGYLNILQWVRDQTPPCPWNSIVTYSAILSNHLHIINWCRSQTPPCLWSSQLTTYAAKQGNLSLLKYLRSFDPPCPWDLQTSLYAAMNGHLDILKWARSQSPKCHWNFEFSLFEACRNGQISIIKYMIEESSSTSSTSMIQRINRAHEFSRRVQNYKVLNWLITNYL
mmetsp:Transcript_5998/g.6194  ORF Transcript_5998/g.6194 Transcript_5998/m.6194 type:complete len:424 (+) Transcript_5998:142-1413(+)